MLQEILLKGKYNNSVHYFGTHKQIYNKCIFNAISECPAKVDILNNCVCFAHFMTVVLSVSRSAPFKIYSKNVKVKNPFLDDLYPLYWSLSL